LAKEETEKTSWLVIDDSDDGVPMGLRGGGERKLSVHAIKVDFNYLMQSAIFQ
jgi:hypothetical protein